MILDRMMPYLGPVIVVANFSVIFMCLRPKHSMVSTLGALAACAVAVHCLVVFGISGYTPLERLSGLLFTPVMLLLFEGQAYQKLFAIFMSYQLGTLTTHIADAFVGVTIGYESPNATATYVVLSLIMLGTYMLLVQLYGRKLFDRMFVENGSGEWALYALGTIFSFFLVMTLDWRSIGAATYFGLVLFILWGMAVLCYTIINSHEKTAQEYNTQTLQLQMKAMREQTEDDKKHRDDMESLRNDMRRELADMVELYRAGRDNEADEIFIGLQGSQTEAASEIVCAEPVLNAVFSRFMRKAADMGVKLYVSSDVPGTLRVDAIQLSVMVSNALENALVATAKVTERNRRIVRVKLINKNQQLGLEVTNPCAEPVEFDADGLPIAREHGHGIGVRSIAAYAAQNDYLLDFKYSAARFTMRLIITDGVSADVH